MPGTLQSCLRPGLNPLVLINGWGLAAAGLHGRAAHPGSTELMLTAQLAQFSHILARFNHTSAMFSGCFGDQVSHPAVLLQLTLLASH